MLVGFLGVIAFIGFVLLGRGPQGNWVGEFEKALEEEKEK
jgi:hypothetical protein